MTDFVDLPKCDGGILSVRPALVAAVETPPRRQICIIHVAGGTFLINLSRTGTIHMLAGRNSDGTPATP